VWRRCGGRQHHQQTEDPAGRVDESIEPPFSRDNDGFRRAAETLRRQLRRRVDADVDFWFACVQ